MAWSVWCVVGGNREIFMWSQYYQCQPHLSQNTTVVTINHNYCNANQNCCNSINHNCQVFEKNSHLVNTNKRSKDSVSSRVVNPIFTFHIYYGCRALLTLREKATFWLVCIPMSYRYSMPQSEASDYRCNEIFHL